MLAVNTSRQYIKSHSEQHHLVGKTRYFIQAPRWLFRLWKWGFLSFKLYQGGILFIFKGMLWLEMAAVLCLVRYDVKWANVKMVKMKQWSLTGQRRRIICSLNDCLRERSKYESHEKAEKQTQGKTEAIKKIWYKSIHAAFSFFCSGFQHVDRMREEEPVERRYNGRWQNRGENREKWWPTVSLED